MYFDSYLTKENEVPEFKKMTKKDLLKTANRLYFKVGEYEQTIRLMTHQSISLLNEHNLLKLRYSDLKESK